MTTNESNLTLSWKRPWSIEEIIQSSQCWSLAADSGVCELIKSFSTNLLTEVGQLSNNVKELSLESKQTNVIIQNAFNDFCMLANNQFMENLVEDVATIPITNENSKINNDLNSNKENSLAQIIPQVTESLKMGIQVLENQFEILDVPKPAPVESNVDESDTEERSGTQLDYMVNEPIYHPKDPYENRHLPHLIGTQAFVDDDTLGIGDIDDQEDVLGSSVASDLDVMEHQSRSISSSISDSESESHRIVRNSESSSDIFNEDQEGNDLFKENPAPVKKVDQPPSLDDQPLSVADQPLSVADQLQRQLRQRLSTKIIDPNSDSDEVSELEVKNNVPSTGANKDQPSRNPVIKPLKPTEITKGIFSEENSDEDDIFGDILADKNKSNTYSFADSLAKQSNKKTRTMPGKSSSDSDHDLILPVSRQTDHKTNIPPSNITNKAKGNKSASNAPVPMPQALSDSDDDLFTEGPLKNKSKLRNPPLQNAESIKPANEKLGTASSVLSTKTNSESEDDIFRLNAKPGSSAAVLQKPPSNERATNLPFSDTDSDSDDIFSNPMKNNKKIDSPALLQSEPTITKRNDQHPKLKNPPLVGRNPFHFSDSSSDEIFDFLKPSNKPKKSKSIIEKITTEPLKTVDNPNSMNPKLPEDSQSGFNKEPERATDAANSNIANVEELVDDYVSKERNNSANNTEDYDKSHDENNDFLNNSTLANNDKKSPITSKVLVKPEEIITNHKSAPFDPLSLPPVRGPLDDFNNSSENGVALKGDSNQYPKATARSSIRPAQINNAGSATAESHSPPNSKNSPLEPEPISDEVPRVSLPKLPAGAKRIGGLTSESLLNEMKNHQRQSRLSFNSDSDSIIEDNNSKITPIPVLVPVSRGADELPKDKIQSETPMKNDFKQKLQNALNIKPFEAPIKQLPTRLDSPDDNEIDFDKPAEEIRQLNLLTKTRAKNIPRRRPTMKKADIAEVVPNFTDISKEEPEKTKAIPQPQIVDTIPAPAIAQSDDSLNIFADLPPRPEKKSKSNKKAAATTSTNKTKKPIEVNVDEISDIFAIPSSKPAKKAKKSKLVSDPLSPL